MENTVISLKQMPEDANLTPPGIVAAIVAVETRSVGGSERDQVTTLLEVLRHAAPAVWPEEVQILRPLAKIPDGHRVRITGNAGWSATFGGGPIAGLEFPLGNTLSRMGWRVPPVASKIGPVDVYNTPNAPGLGSDPVQISVRMTPGSAFSPFIQSATRILPGQPRPSFSFSSDRVDGQTGEKWGPTCRM